jgi:putative transcriptional regulator
MNKSFGDDLMQSLGEVLAHMKDTGHANVHRPVDSRIIRQSAGLTQAQMAPIMGMGMSLSGYRKWEQGKRAVCGP